MPALLTAETFDKLLHRLDADRDQAGRKYEALRRTLLRFFEWRSAPFPDEHTDETFDRVARKLDDSVEIRSLGGYCHEVARLICLEALKGRDSKRRPLDEDRLIAGPPGDGVEEDRLQESRLACLDGCLETLSPESRQLILEYHQDGTGTRTGRRKAQAGRLGVPRDALANRAQRVRNRLEECVSNCVATRGTI